MRRIDLPEGLSGSNLIPSLAVMGKTPVYVEDGRYNKIILDGEDVSSVQVASILSRDFERMHYLDILGIRDGSVEWNMFQSIMDVGNEVWADTGAVVSDSVIDIIMSGATRAIISTKMVESLEEIVSSLELSDNLVLQMDYNGKLVSKDGRIVKMDPADFASEMAALGIEDFIIDDITPERNRISTGILEDILDVLGSECSVYAGAEEISEAEDVIARGARGAIISCSRILEGIR
ncbi:MAG: HisA/HisF-related TIM barrel protein [Thermoplasmatota archaeon]